MLTGLVAATERDGFKKGEVVLWLGWDGFGIEESLSNEAREKLHQIPGDFVLIEKDKFNAMVGAYSMRQIREKINAHGNDLEPTPGYRAVTAADLWCSPLIW